MQGYRLSKRAAADLVRIHLEGIRQFGPAQADKYIDELEACFDLLTTQPRLGRLAPSIRDGVRRHEHASHVVLYEIDDAVIVILAVVHGRSIRALEL